MKFAYTIIYVDDVVQTVNFYQAAFGLSLGFMHESKQYAELQTGGVKLAFASDRMGEINGLCYTSNRLKNTPPGVEIALTTDDVLGAYESACQAGAEGVKPAEVKPWGQTVAYVRDINGVYVELCTPMGGV